MSNWKFMFVLELSSPKSVSIPNFSTISLQMADFSRFLAAKSCEVPSLILFNFVAMATAQNSTNWFDLQTVSKRCIFKVRKFQLDNLSSFGMVEENIRGTYFAPPPPGEDRVNSFNTFKIVPAREKRCSMVNSLSPETVI